MFAIYGNGSPGFRRVALLSPRDHLHAYMPQFRSDLTYQNGSHIRPPESLTSYQGNAARSQPGRPRSPPVISSGDWPGTLLSVPEFTCFPAEVDLVVIPVSHSVAVSVALRVGSVFPEPWRSSAGTTPASHFPSSLARSVTITVASPIGLVQLHVVEACRIRRTLLHALGYYPPRSRDAGVRRCGRRECEDSTHGEPDDREITRAAHLCLPNLQSRRKGSDEACRPSEWPGRRSMQQECLHQSRTISTIPRSAVSVEAVP
jgi:hypothetical protein